MSFYGTIEGFAIFNRTSKIMDLDPKPQNDIETSSKKFRRPLGIVPVIAVTAALWGFSANGAPPAPRSGSKSPTTADSTHAAVKTKRSHQA